MPIIDSSRHHSFGLSWKNTIPCLLIVALKELFEKQKPLGFPECFRCSGNHCEWAWAPQNFRFICLSGCFWHTRESTPLLPEARGQCADGKSLQKAQQARLLSLWSCANPRDGGQGSVLRHCWQTWTYSGCVVTTGRDRRTLQEMW